LDLSVPGGFSGRDGVSFPVQDQVQDRRQRPDPGRGPRRLAGAAAASDSVATGRLSIAGGFAVPDCGRRNGPRTPSLTLNRTRSLPRKRTPSRTLFRKRSLSPLCSGIHPCVWSCALLSASGPDHNSILNRQKKLLRPDADGRLINQKPLNVFPGCIDIQ